MSAQPPTLQSSHRVEPPFVVLTSKTALPRRCFVTNHPVNDSEYQIWSLPSIPRWMWWLTFVSPILLIAYPALARNCKVAAGLSKRVRRKLLIRRAILVLMILAPVLLTIGAIVNRSSELLLAAVTLSIVPYVALPILVLLTPPLRGHRSRNGLFWIAGCSPEFLRSLETCGKETLE
jgi:hypothetical protein